MRLHFVVARHTENMQWLWQVLQQQPDWTATIYNDGPVIEAIDKLNPAVQARIQVVEGDHIPCEPTKYIQYILDHYDTVLKEAEDADVRFVFTQADPLYHSPRFLHLLLDAEDWKTPYQTLTLFPHPPPWGCAQGVLNGTVPGIERFKAGGMAWSEPDMDDTFMGSVFKDPFCVEVREQARGITLSYLCALFGLQRPPHVPKTYCALFATTAKAMRKVSHEQWSSIQNFMMQGDPNYTHGLLHKQRAFFLEYLWPVLCLQP